MFGVNSAGNSSDQLFLLIRAYSLASANVRDNSVDSTPRDSFSSASTGNGLFALIQATAMIHEAQRQAALSACFIRGVPQTVDLNSTPTRRPSMDQLQLSTRGGDVGLPSSMLSSAPTILHRLLDSQSREGTVLPLLQGLIPPENTQSLVDSLLRATGERHAAASFGQSVGVQGDSDRKRRSREDGSETPGNRDASRKRIRQSVAAREPACATAKLCDEESKQQPEIQEVDFLLSGCFPLAHDSVDQQLTKYQSAVRKQLEVFVVDKNSIHWSVRGRKKPVRIGQVGIRCKHCKHLPYFRLETGASYFPTRMSNVYQAAQNIARTHLLKSCKSIDATTRHHIQSLCDEGETTKSGRKQEWVRGCKELGVYEAQDGQGLRMRKGAR